MMASLTSLEKSIVRIFGQNGNIAGAGFLVAEKSIITCTHVIFSAGELHNHILGPKILIDFPLIAPKHQIQTHVAFSSPAEDLDFSELVPESVLPRDVNSTSIMTNIESILGHHIKVYGFPDRYDNGVWASGIVAGRTAQGWLQVEATKELGYRIQPGFSGGPAWDEQLGAIIGMVVAADRDEKTKAAFILPMSSIFTNHLDLREKVRVENYYQQTSYLRQLLDNKDFEKTLASCSEIFKENIYSPSLHIFAAIALTRGRPIDRLSQNTVQIIESHLTKAINDKNTECTALVMLGAIKFDVYHVNGLKEESPTFLQISKRLQDLNFRSVDFQLLKYLIMSDDALRKMGLKHTRL